MEEKVEAQPVVEKQKKKLVIFDFKSPLGIINFCIATICSLVCWGYFVYSLATSAAFPVIIRYGGIAVAMFAVYLFMLIFRVQLGNIFQLILHIHLFFAGFLGTNYSFYGKYEIYDDLMHLLFGFVGSIVGLYVCCKLNDIYKLKPLFVALVLYGVAMAMGSVWEIWEFSVDQLLGQNSQGNPVNGVAPYVIDTMWDIINNTIGSVVFILLYLLTVLTKKNILVGSLMKEFSSK